MLTKMLKVAPFEEGEGGSGEAPASTKEAIKEGGIKSPTFRVEKRTSSEDPEVKASKRGKGSSANSPAREVTQPHYFPKGVSPPASHKLKRRGLVNKEHPCIYL